MATKKIETETNQNSSANQTLTIKDHPTYNRGYENAPIDRTPQSRRYDTGIILQIGLCLIWIDIATFNERLLAGTWKELVQEKVADRNVEVSDDEWAAIFTAVNKAANSRPLPASDSALDKGSRAKLLRHDADAEVKHE